MPLSQYATILNGKYRILNLIGQGAVSRVWLAEELTSGRRYRAMKEALASQSTREGRLIRDRFLREARLSAALAQIHTPHIVHALAVEQFEDSALLVLTYQAGGDLKRLIQNAPAGCRWIELCASLETMYSCQSSNQNASNQVRYDGDRPFRNNL